MHLLLPNEILLRDRSVVVFPKRIRIVSNVAARKRETKSVSFERSQIGRERGDRMGYALNGHQPYPRQDAHDRKQLPEVNRLEKVPATDIYTMRPIHINIALHQNITR